MIILQPRTIPATHGVIFLCALFFLMWICSPKRMSQDEFLAQYGEAKYKIELLRADGSVYGVLEAYDIYEVGWGKRKYRFEAYELRDGIVKNTYTDILKQNCRIIKK